MVQKHIMMSTSEHWILLKSLMFRSTEISAKTIQNNVDYSFETFLTLEKWDFSSQYISYTVIKKTYVWKYYQRFPVRNYSCLICILSCIIFSQIIFCTRKQEIILKM